jgi:hypothetical protein
MTVIDRKLDETDCTYPFARGFATFIILLIEDRETVVALRAI